MQIQSHLGSTIAMAFDECIENPSPRDYVQKSVARTTRWVGRCQKEMARLNSLEDTVNPHQLLVGINQGGTYEDIRVQHMKDIAAMGLDGYAIGDWQWARAPKRCIISLRLWSPLPRRIRSVT